jgi:hypothetical protein
LALDKILITFHDGDNLEQFIQKINDKINSSILERKYNELLKKKLILQRKGQLEISSFAVNLFLETNGISKEVEKSL